MDGPLHGLPYLMSLKRHISNIFPIHNTYTDYFDVDIDNFYFLFRKYVVSACQNESGKKVNAPILLAICGFCAEKKDKKDSYLEIFCGYLYLTFAAAVSYKEGVYITHYYALTRF